MPRRITGFLTAGLCAVALAAGFAAYALQESASTEYALYQSERWHFSLGVPDDMTAQVSEQKGGGQLIQFVDVSGEHVFEVATWPYAELDLTLDQTGAPRGVSDQPDHLEIVDIVRDEYFSVLFQKNGVRYAVVTSPTNEQWLTQILKTWQFTD